MKINLHHIDAGWFDSKRDATIVTLAESRKEYANTEAVTCCLKEYVLAHAAQSRAQHELEMALGLDNADSTNTPMLNELARVLTIITDNTDDPRDIDAGCVAHLIALAADDWHEVAKYDDMGATITAELKVGDRVRKLSPVLVEMWDERTEAKTDAGAVADVRRILKTGVKVVFENGFECEIDYFDYLDNPRHYRKVGV